MLICQWHLDVPYGKLGDAVSVMKAWGAEKFASSEFRRARGARLLCGMLGASASHVVDEYEFDSLADFEAALAGMSAPQFRSHSEALAAYVVPGSQHWVVYRVMDQHRPA
ncbi:MAG TPA: hypothetical protein VIG08_00820 [Gemmatimonadales bacterium]|jgi:hypothetical protein